MANHPNRKPDIEERAIRFAMGIIMRSTDWQEAQHALADHDEFGPWLDSDGDGASKAQSVIRRAEGRLGDKLPANYG